MLYHGGLLILMAIKKIEYIGITPSPHVHLPVQYKNVLSTRIRTVIFFFFFHLGYSSLYTSQTFLAADKENMDIFSMYNILTSARNVLTSLWCWPS